MKPTKTQIAELADELSTPYGSVSLLCDGYRVTLAVRCWKPLSYRVMIFINGFFEWKWTDTKTEYPEQKFLRKSVVRLCPPAEKKKAEKAIGKRYVKKSDYYNATLTQLRPDFLTGRAAIVHLCKVCESVEIIQEATQP